MGKENEILKYLKKIKSIEKDQLEVLEEISNQIGSIPGGDAEQIQQLRRQLNQLQGEVAQLQSRTTVLESQNAQLQTQITQLQTQVNQLESQDAQLQTQITQLQTQVNQLQEQLQNGIIPNPALQSFFENEMGSAVTISTQGGTFTGVVTLVGPDAVQIREANGNIVIIPFAQITTVQ